MSFNDFMADLESGDCEKVRRLFKREFAEKLWFGRTPLQIACGYDYVDIVKYLLSEGCDIEFGDTGGRRPIHIVACRDYIATLTILIKAGCSLDCVNVKGETPLAVATRRLNTECVQILKLSMEKRTYVKQLKETGLSIILDTDTGKTLLDKLLSYQDPQIMDEIQSIRVDEQEIKDWISLRLQRVDPKSYRLLHECLLRRCIYQKYDDGVYTICTAEIVNIDSLFMGPSPLETAVKFSSHFWVKHILEKLVRDDESWKRATDIANNKNLPYISSLISERIVYLNCKNAIGFSRLHIAVLDNDPDMVEFILKNKIVHPDEVHKIFGTALSMAYSLNQMECVQILQNNNVNVNIVDKFGQSPLHMAITNEIEDHCDYLVNNTTNIDAKDCVNLTVLERAVMNDCENVCELLVRKGANCDIYLDIHTSLDKNQDNHMWLKNVPCLPLTKKESICTLCLKVNRTIYPCLVDKIGKTTINYTDGEENTLLHLCAILLLPRLCSEMILKSANVNFINKKGETALMGLIKCYQCPNKEQIEGDLIDTVNVLIDGGASLNIMYSNGRSVIDMASELHNEKLLQTLMQKQEFDHIKDLMETDLPSAKLRYDHASFDVKRKVLGAILYKAASIGDKILFGEMINADIPTDDCLYGGESLLNRLIQERNTDMIQIIISSRNSSLFWEKKGIKRKLPLHLCIECNCWEITAQIILDTSSVNDEDDDGNTPMSLLLMRFSESSEDGLNNRLMVFVKMLIKQNADIYTTNLLGRTAISYCTIPQIKIDVESTFRKFHSSHILLPHFPAMCLICDDEPINCTFNCGHVCCMTCGEKIFDCHMCRQPIISRIKTFQ